MAIEKTLKFKTGTKNTASGSAIATVLSATDDLYQVVTFTADKNNTAGEAILFGDSNVTSAAAGERGRPLIPGAEITLDAAEAEKLGMRGAGSQRYVNLKDLYIDSLTDGDTLSWFGYK